MRKVGIFVRDNLNIGFLNGAVIRIFEAISSLILLYNLIYFFLRAYAKLRHAMFWLFSMKNIKDNL